MVSTQDLLKYIVLGTVVYLSFRFTVGRRYSPQDTGFIAGGVVFVYAVLEHLCRATDSSEPMSSTTHRRTKSNPALDSLLENFADTVSCASGECRAEPMANVSPQITDAVTQANVKVVGDAPAETDNNSFLEREEDLQAEIESRDSQIEQQADRITELEEHISTLQNLVQSHRTPKTALQRRMDPYDDPGHGYSTQPNRLTETDASIAADQRRIGKGGSSPPGMPVIRNEMVYTDYNHLPVADGYQSTDYEYGYSFIPPEKWYPTPPNPPVCVTTNPETVRPSYTQGAPVDVKEWHSSRRITQPDVINRDYISDKLNSGR